MLKMSAFSNLSTAQKVQVALHKDVRAICTEVCHLLGLEITRPAIEVIAELVLKKCNVYGIDLEAFAKHAKRSTINAEDVKLLARRNPSLKARLNALSSTSASKEKRRKTVLPVMKPVEEVSKESKEANSEDMAVDQIDLTFD